MPIRSKAQRRYLHWAAAHGKIDPKVVEEFEQATPKGKKLPEHVAAKEAGALGQYAAHSAMNLGQAAYDIKNFGRHPDADKVSPRGTAHHLAASITSRLPSLATNLYYAALPPQLHHTKEELQGMEHAPLKDWFMYGYDLDDPDHPEPDKRPKTAAYDAGVARALKEAGLIEEKDQSGNHLLTDHGKQTRLRKDHESSRFYNVRRSFERAATQKKVIGTHVSLKEPKE